MKTTFSALSMTCRKACWLGFATLALLAVLAPHAEAQSSLTAYYDPATGNIKLQNTTASVLSISSFNLLTLGNGSKGAATPNSLGYLNGATVNATTPGSGISFTNGFSFRTSNIQSSGANGQYSQIAAVLLPDELAPQPMFALNGYAGWSASSPIGPAGTYWDVGNVAALGMSQSDLNARFLTDDASPVTGQFLYSTLAGSGVTSAAGNVINVVPEPSTMALAAIGVAGLGLSRLRRRS